MQQTAAVSSDHVDSPFDRAQPIFETGAGQGFFPKLYGKVEVWRVWDRSVAAAHYVSEGPRLLADAATRRRLCPVKEVKSVGVRERVNLKGTQ